MIDLCHPGIWFGSVTISEKWDNCFAPWKTGRANLLNRYNNNALPDFVEICQAGALSAS